MGVEISTNYSNSTYQTSDTTATQTANQTAAAENAQAGAQTGDTAVVYEKSTEGVADSSKQIYSKENRANIIKQLKADAAERQQKMIQLVADTLNGQKLKNDIASLFGSDESNGIGLKSIFEAMEVDQETIDQAKADIAEDGYWGVEQTSDRMVEMAKALAGGDSSKADLLMEAVQKGFDQATKSWGDELPEISKKTLEATMEKLTKWRDGTEEAVAETVVTQ